MINCSVETDNRRRIFFSSARSGTFLTKGIAVPSRDTRHGGRAVMEAFFEAEAMMTEPQSMRWCGHVHFPSDKRSADQVGSPLARILLAAHHRCRRAHGNTSVRASVSNIA